MKKEHLLFGTLGCVAFALAGFGVGALLGTAKTTTAESKTGEDHTYFARVYKNDKITSDLPTTLYAYSWDAADTNITPATTQMTFVNSTTYTTDLYSEFSITLSSDFRNILFMSASTFGSGTTQSVDFGIPAYVTHTAPGYKVACELTYYTSGKWDGEWNAVTKPTLTQDYMRLWLSRGNLTDYTFAYEYSTLAGIVSVPPSAYINLRSGSSSDYLPYYDVPKAAVGCNGIWVAFSRGTEGGVSAPVVYATGDNAKVYYVSSESTFTSISVSQGIYGKSITAEACKVLFYPYYTCLKDKDNGYENFGTFAETWLHDSANTWYVVGNLGGISNDDCNATTDYATGARSTTGDLYLKYSIMLTEYNALSGSGSGLVAWSNDSHHDSAIVITIVTAAAAIAAAGSLMLLKKKKTD